MKEVTYRKELSEDRKSKFISFKENMENMGRRVDIYKNYFYNIKEEAEFQNQNEVEDFFKNSEDPKNLTNTYIKRIVDSKSNKVIVSYIVKGDIFALVKRKLYKISFKQENILESSPL